jgi:hypothetical protein
MDAAVTRPGVLLRACLAERLGQEDLDWLDMEGPLMGQGVGSLDLIAALARLQRATGLGLSDGFVVCETTSLASVARSLCQVGVHDRGAARAAR